MLRILTAVTNLNAYLNNYSRESNSRYPEAVIESHIRILSFAAGNRPAVVLK